MISTRRAFKIRIVSGIEGVLPPRGLSQLCRGPSKMRAVHLTPTLLLPLLLASARAGPGPLPMSGVWSTGGANNFRNWRMDPPPGFSGRAPAPTPVLAWNFSAYGGEALWMPSMSRDAIIAGSARLYGIALNGTLQYTTPPCIGGAQEYAWSSVDEDGNLYIDPRGFAFTCSYFANGTYRWHNVNRYPGLSGFSVLAGNGVLFTPYAPNGEKSIALNASTGELLWGGVDFFSTPFPAVDPGGAAIYYINDCLHLTKIHASNGSRAWQNDWPSSHNCVGPALAADGRVFLFGNNVRAFDGATGAELWGDPNGYGVYGSARMALSAGDKRFILACVRCRFGKEGHLVVAALDTSNGAELWRYEDEDLIRAALAVIVDANDDVHVITHDGGISLTRDGTLRFKYPLPDGWRFEEAPILGAGGELYAPATDDSAHWYLLSFASGP